METYAYINEVLDTHPDVVRLRLCDLPVGGAPSNYSVATGPVPPGQVAIPARVVVEAKSDPDDPTAFGYDASSVVVVTFRC